MSILAKRSALNAIRKIDGQLSELNKNKSKNKAVQEKENVPIISKNDLDKAVRKAGYKKTNRRYQQNGKNNNTNTNKNNYSVNNKNNSNTKKSNYYERQQKRYRQTSSFKTANKTFINKSSVSPKNKKVSEDTVKLHKLEDEIRNLYSKEPIILDGTTKKKVVVDTKDVLVSDVLSVEKETTIDKISMTFLNRLLLVVTVLFTILFIAFIGFVVFITTF